MDPGKLIKKCLLILAWISLAALSGACQSLTSTAAPASDAGAKRVLRVVTSGGLAAAYDSLAARFEAETGIDLLTAYGSSSGGAPDSIPLRLERGEPFDLIILSKSSLNRLTERGEVRPETRRDLARSSIGMAVRQGAHMPDISTPDLFLDVLHDAESIGYSASASGTYLSTVLFPRLGVWEQLEPKSHRILSERVAAVVARGEVEIGFQQISEILPIQGASLVGPIPSEFQKVTTFSAGITMRAKNVTDAERLIDFLASREVATAIAETGLEPVVPDP